MEEHPGGRGYLTAYIGKDATTAVFGGVYEHSNAAHNVRYFLTRLALRCEADGDLLQLLAMMRVGVLFGGIEHVTEAAIPPSQKLQIVERKNEI